VKLHFNELMVMFLCTRPTGMFYLLLSTYNNTEICAGEVKRGRVVLVVLFWILFVVNVM